MTPEPAVLSELTITEVEEALSEHICEVTVPCGQPAVWWDVLGVCCGAVVAKCPRHKYGLSEAEMGPGGRVNWGNGLYDCRSCGAIGAPDALRRWIPIR